MTPEKPTVAPNSQDWAGMDGATAFHLITRHSDNWSDAALMMDEWRRANLKQSALDHLRDCSAASFAEPLEGGLWLCVGTKESIAEWIRMNQSFNEWWDGHKTFGRGLASPPQAKEEE